MSKSYRDKVQKARWIEIALTSIETRRKRGSIDSNLSRAVEKLSRCAKKNFSKKRKIQTLMQPKHATQPKIHSTFSTFRNIS